MLLFVPSSIEQLASLIKSLSRLHRILNQFVSAKEAAVAVKEPSSRGKKKGSFFRTLLNKLSPASFRTLLAPSGVVLELQGTEDPRRPIWSHLVDLLGFLGKNIDERGQYQRRNCSIKAQDAHLLILLKALVGELDFALGLLEEETLGHSLSAAPHTSFSEVREDLLETYRQRKEWVAMLLEPSSICAVEERRLGCQGDRASRRACRALSWTLLYLAVILVSRALSFVKNDRPFLLEEREDDLELEHFALIMVGLRSRLLLVGMALDSLSHLSKAQEERFFFQQLSLRPRVSTRALLEGFAQLHRVTGGVKGIVGEDEELFKQEQERWCRLSLSALIEAMKAPMPRGAGRIQRVGSLEALSSSSSPKGVKETKATKMSGGEHLFFSLFDAGEDQFHQQGPSVMALEHPCSLASAMARLLSFKNLLQEKVTDRDSPLMQLRLLARLYVLEQLALSLGQWIEELTLKAFDLSQSGQDARHHRCEDQEAACDSFQALGAFSGKGGERARLAFALLKLVEPSIKEQIGQIEADLCFLHHLWHPLTITSCVKVLSAFTLLREEFGFDALRLLLHVYDSLIEEAALVEQSDRERS